jgi:hypothetical protein
VDVSIRITKSAADPLNLKPQAARLETRRNFFSNRVVEVWNMVPGVIKKINKKRAVLKLHRRQREHDGKRLGWHRDGNQPAGPHPNPDTSYETLHVSLDVNLPETRNKSNVVGISLNWTPPPLYFLQMFATYRK